jgi:hypothetical protein
MADASKGTIPPTATSRTIILTVPEARATLGCLEHRTSRNGEPAFELVTGDVAAIRARTGDLLQEWSALRRELGVASRFNDPAGFLRGVAGHHGQPVVLFVRDVATQPVSVVVGTIEEDPIVHRIGYLRIRTPRLRTLRIPETGILCARDPAAAGSVARVLGELLHASAIDHLAIHNLEAENPLAGPLDAFAKRGIGLVCVPRVHRRTRLLDAATGERLVHHSSKTRSTLRRKSRKLDEAFGGKVDLVRVERADQVDGFIRDATSIIRQTYQAALGIGVKETPAYRQLLIDTASDGALCGYTLKTADVAIAYLVGDVHDKVFRLWATSFLPQYGALSPGIVLIFRALDEFAAQGIAVFDFGFGEADYKSMFGSELLHEFDWRVYSRSLRGRTAFLSDRVTGSCDALARRLLRSRNLVARVKKFWRGRLRRNRVDGAAEPSGQGESHADP